MPLADLPLPFVLRQDMELPLIVWARVEFLISRGDRVWLICAELCYLFAMPKNLAMSLAEFLPMNTIVFYTEHI